jgi:hypothetical protein
MNQILLACSSLNIQKTESSKLRNWFLFPDAAYATFQE